MAQRRTPRPSIRKALINYFKGLSTGDILGYITLFLGFLGTMIGIGHVFLKMQEDVEEIEGTHHSYQENLNYIKEIPKIKEEIYNVKIQLTLQQEQIKNIQTTHSKK
ncbi:hypothetical protein [Emticicia fontis]